MDQEKSAQKSETPIERANPNLNLLWVGSRGSNEQEFDRLLDNTQSLGHCESRWARNLEQALSELERFVFDLVLFDLDCIENSTLGALVRFASSVECPILCYCSSGNEGLAKDAVGAGIADYLLRGRLIRNSWQQYTTKCRFQRAESWLV